MIFPVSVTGHRFTSQTSVLTGYFSPSLNSDLIDHYYQSNTTGAKFPAFSWENQDIMDTTRGTNLWRTRQKKTDLASVLRKAWYHLRLSLRHPTRVATWDAIVLTAASPEQAELYEWQLNRARRMGRIAQSTVTLAVPDPDGQRIGSGAATLNAIYALAKHYEKLGVELGPEVFPTVLG